MADNETNPLITSELHVNLHREGGSMNSSVVDGSDRVRDGVEMNPLLSGARWKTDLSKSKISSSVMHDAPEIKTNDTNAVTEPKFRNWSPVNAFCENEDIDMTEVVSIQSLLMQFSVPSVRADFVNGKFKSRFENIDFLPMIDELRWTLLPRWKGSGYESIRARSSIAMYHFRELLRRSSSTMLIDGSKNKVKFSYMGWYDALMVIANDVYWTETSVEQRCTHIIATDSSPVEYQPTVTPMIPSTNINLSQVSDRRSRSLKSSRVKVEEIVLSSGSSSCPSSTSTSSDGDSPSTDSGRRRHRHRRQKKSDRREVVTPPSFMMDGTMSLKDFFVSYDDFFAKKFRGNEYDKTQKLAEFLSGDLLEVYKIKGGRKIRYEKMKRHLLEYYKEQRVGGKSYWRKKLVETQPEHEESYEIFGLRLLETAEHAYPGDNRECASQLRREFLKKISSKIRDKIIDLEATMKATSKGKEKHLNFSAMRRLATDLQKKQKSRDLTNRTVMWANQEQDGFASCEVTGKNKFGREFRSRNRSLPPPRSPINRQRSQVRRDEKQSQVRCSYCENPNHVRRDCWRANKQCLICGADHMMTQCPRYDPQYKDKNSATEKDLN